MIAFYPFTDGSLADASLNNNDLVRVKDAIPRSDRDGNKACAYEFFDSFDSSFLSTPNTAFLNNLTHFSVVLWYLPLDTGQVYGNEILVSRGLDLKCPPRNGEWSVGVFESGLITFGHQNVILKHFSVWDGDYDDYFNAIYDSWHHVAAVKDGDKMLLYLDGKLASSVTGSKPCSSGLPLDIGDLFIGEGLRGCLDDIIIYDRAIDHDEVKKLMGLSTCCK